MFWWPWAAPERRSILTIAASTHCAILILMSGGQQQTNDPLGAGLCAACLHSRSIESARGSVFIFCNLSQTDPRFPKYPRLPVLSCDGYKKKN
jgi:hypothetical protein